MNRRVCVSQPVVLAAYLCAQLEKMDEITEKRQSVYEAYQTRLNALANRALVTLPTIPPHCRPNYHMFYILLRDLETRAHLIEHLKQVGIMAVFHYVPLHTSPVGKAMGYREGMLPVTENLSNRLLRLPMYYDITEGDIAQVTDSIAKFYDAPARSRQ